MHRRLPPGVHPRDTECRGASTPPRDHAERSAFRDTRTLQARRKRGVNGPASFGVGLALVRFGWPAEARAP